jgi:hypothetical protein
MNEIACRMPDHPPALCLANFLLLMLSTAIMSNAKFDQRDNLRL